MSQAPLMFGVCRMRSGAFLKIPDSIDDLNCLEFLSHFTVDEHVDILCLTECLTRRFAEQGFQGKGHKGVEILNDALRSKIAEPAFASALIKLGLHNSLNYVHFGERLLQW